jgi:hypothetical protein
VYLFDPADDVDNLFFLFALCWISLARKLVPCNASTVRVRVLFTNCDLEGACHPIISYAADRVVLVTRVNAAALLCRRDFFLAELAFSPPQIFLPSHPNLD